MVYLYIKKNEFDEYEVVWEENGRKVEDKTYYTDDLADAQATYSDTLRWALSKGIRMEGRRNQYTPMAQFSKEV